MTVAHLLFALATTGDILIAIQLEERALTRFRGNEYRQYRQRAPMILPWRTEKSSPPAVTVEEKARTAV
jgi:protein-S-isoprenylcysteine O-methyltransferase Ste14